MSKAIKVLLSIESRVYREGLKLILARHAQLECTGACSGPQQVPAWLRDGTVDVILVDVSLGQDGLDPCKKVAALHRAAEGVPIVALGLDQGDAEVLALFESGAAAFVSKNHSIEEFAAIVVTAAQGEVHLAPHMVRLLQERLTALNCALKPPGWNGLAKLSQRERHILELVGRRLSNKQIARDLGLEVSTIKNHLHNIIVKLGVKNRIEAASLAEAG
jgi:DNA-binding NarL/FixJ family response regulator